MRFLNLLPIINSNLENTLKSLEWAKILDIEKTNFNFDSKMMNISNYKSELEDQNVEEYIQLAKYFDINDEEFKEILKNILNPIKEVFFNETFKKPNQVQHYSAIIGPSFMGKPQFRFILARIHPVFYFNFCADTENYKQMFIKVLLHLKNIS